MARLDAALELLLAQKELHDRDPSASALPLAPGEPIYIAIRYHGAIGPIEQAGFSAASVVGNIAFGQTTLDGLAALASHPQVESIERQRRQLTHDGSVPEIRANLVWSRSGDNFSGYTGRGVVVGIIDTGIDFKHNAFRKKDGTSRVLNIWDQTLGAQGGETTPAPFGYGVEYDISQINDTLAGGTPAVRVRHVDADGHGTHVAGIAAGDGSQAGHCHGIYRYIGVATDADLIVVRKWGLTKGDSNAPSTSTSTLVDAVNYIIAAARRAAPSRAVVINASLGLLSEFMDGTSSESQAIDAVMTANSTGTAMVLSAGNEADGSFHAAGTVPASPAAGLSLEFSLYGQDTKSRTLVVLYSGANLQARVSSPVSGSAGVVGWVASGGTASSTTANGSGSSVVVSNQANRIAISIGPSSGGANMAGTWKLELKDTGGAATPINAYCLYGTSHDPNSPRFSDHVNVRSTLSALATGKEIVAVGSYREGGALSSFSSRGPTFDGRVKPDICAPGEDICSAGIGRDRACENCCCACCHDFYVDKSGTSMSAPHVTGVIALMLHKNPNLTHTEVLNLLRANFASKPSDSTPDDDVGWGAGRVDAKKVVDAVVQVNPPVASVTAEASALARLRERLLQAPRGRALESAVEEHGSEVWNLIQQNRRVATIWHRCAGPVWVRLALRAAHTPQAALPLTADGIDLRYALHRFGVALKRYGSAQLRQAIEAWEGDIVCLKDGVNLADLVEAIGNGAPAAPSTN